MTKKFTIKPYDRTRMEYSPDCTPCGMMGEAGDDLIGSFWPDIIRELGIIGFYAEREPDSPGERPPTIGHIIFFPKRAARKLAYPTSPTDADIDKTLYLWCIYGMPLKDDLAHIDALIERTLKFARENEYMRFEACSAASGSQTHHDALMKHGFKQDKTMKYAHSARGRERVELLYWQNRS